MCTYQTTAMIALNQTDNAGTIEGDKRGGRRNILNATIICIYRIWLYYISILFSLCICKHLCGSVYKHSHPINKNASNRRSVNI